MKLIDYEKVSENIKQLTQTKKLMLVLKDNAYNFGLIKVLQIARKLNIYMFATNNISGAIKIRKECDKCIILLLGKVPNNVSILKKYRITLSVDNVAELDICVKNQIFYHLKINTSMNRFGIEYENIGRYITKYLKGIYIHVPTNNKEENLDNLKVLNYYVKKYKLGKYIVHLGGSNILPLNFKYTYRIAKEIYNDALKYFGKIIEIRDIKKGSYVGYEHGYKAHENIKIGICNLGYANGLIRENDNVFVYINNKKYPFIGVKCMDYSYILIDDDVKKNDIVEVIGNNINIDYFCRMNKIIPHEAYLKLK